MLKKLGNIDKIRIKRKRSSLQRAKRGRDNHTILNGCSPISSNSRKVAQKTVPKLFQTKDGTKFTNIIGVSLRTIKIFASRTWLKQ